MVNKFMIKIERGIKYSSMEKLQYLASVEELNNKKFYLHFKNLF